VDSQSIDERLLTVANLADPDPWRNRLRDAIGRNDGDELKMLARDAEALNQRPETILLLARSLVGRTWYDQAIALLEQAQQRYPADFFINIELASSLRWLNPPRTEDAVAYRRAAVAIRPDSAIAYDHLAYALRNIGRLDEAEAAYRTAIRLRPNVGFDRYNLANFLIGRGRRTEAEEVFRQAPPPPQGADNRVYNNYASILIGLHRFTEAEAASREAIQIAPEWSEAYMNLGMSLAGQKKFQEATAAYATAIQLKRNDRELSGAVNALAWLLATAQEDSARDGRRALELATQACELTDYKDASVLDSLAAANAETGDFEAAIEWTNKAIALAPEEATREGLLRHLESFQAERPWREQMNDPPNP
jgi:Flp pilus assembly protein TadD